MANKPLPDQSYLINRFRYDPDTGHLFFKEQGVDEFKASGSISAQTRMLQWNSLWSGKRAFTAINGAGYHVGNLRRSVFLAHRIIWKMTYGDEPELIDHVNRIKTDNRLSNLRAATKRQNSWNAKLRSDNRSELKNIKRSSNGTKWVVYVVATDRVSYRGSFDCLGQAIAVRDATRTALMEAEQKRSVRAV